MPLMTTILANWHSGYGGSGAVSNSLLFVFNHIIPRRCKKQAPNVAPKRFSNNFVIQLFVSYRMSSYVDFAEEPKLETLKLFTIRTYPPNPHVRS